MNIKTLRILGYILFFVGVIFSFALAVVSTWNRVEATNYYFSGATYPLFKGLHCPVMITRSEQGSVTAVFDNPVDQVDNVFYRVEISNIAAPRRIADQIAVPPHGRERLQWGISAADIDLRFFVFVKITTQPNALRPTREATCGIAVLNIPGVTGNQIFMIAMALSLLGIGMGLGLLQRANLNAEPSTRYGLLVLGVVVLLALMSGLIGWWLAGIALEIITILLLVIFARVALS